MSCRSLRMASSTSTRRPRNNYSDGIERSPLRCTSLQAGRKRREDRINLRARRLQRIVRRDTAFIETKPKHVLYPRSTPRIPSLAVGVA